ncbi:MAG: thymidine phosphorylase [Bdellovibrionota bacterium]|nr:thymidine phosphorylase [Bdellovibrionota bacterium]
MEKLAREFIKDKRDKKTHKAEEVTHFIQSYLKDEIPDYQMSAWLMASLLNGLDKSEAAALTKAMLESGYQFDFSHLEELKVDKHSTGGVGDKATMILAPIVAACGVRVPMIAGRGLGHTGGTLDKLDSIKGFNTRISKTEFQNNVENIGYSIMGQTEEICPADKRIYSLRDVTATVESIPLICASIMSKKLAEGINGLVLDVKVGSGAFMKTIEDAKKLAISLKEIGEQRGCKVHAIITDINQVLGRHVGNANEIYECMEILKNTNDSKNLYNDCRELSLVLATHMISIGKNIGLEEARSQAESTLEDGSAWKKFLELVEVQGGNLQIEKPVYEKQVLASRAGYIESFDTEKIGVAGIIIGAGRKIVSDEIDYLSGIYVEKKIGDKVSENEPVFSVFAENKEKYAEAMEMLESCFEISEHPIQAPDLIKELVL